MKFSLVAQLPEEQYGNIDWIYGIEDKLMAALVGTEADVDGHDIGSGTINFFIYTNEPMLTFEIVKTIFAQENILMDAKIAYRNISSEDYVCLWPEGLTEFDLL